MDGKTTIRYLQEYIKSKDYCPDLTGAYFLKLSEEVGELAKAIRKNLRSADGTDIKGTIDEELWDVIYYAIAIANCYGIDLERAIELKEGINNEKYNTGIFFDPYR